MKFKNLRMKVHLKYILEYYDCIWMMVRMNLFNFFVKHPTFAIFVLVKENYLIL